MRCDDISEVLGAWLDGQLRQSDAEEIRAHVAGCPSCGEERRQLEGLQKALRATFQSASTTIVFESFWRGVERRIHQKRSWYEDVRRWVRDFWAPPQMAWSVPIAIILLLLGMFTVESFLPGLRPRESRNNFAAVDSIDAFGRNVAVLREDESKTTVIWLYLNQEGEDESSGETSESGRSF